MSTTVGQIPDRIGPVFALGFRAVNRPTGRVLTLLELLQSGGTRTSAELAERLGVDGRTVRRYVDHLIDLDIPVESVRGRYGGYRLAPGYRLPPLMLNDEEALAVLFGLSASNRSGLMAETGTAGETAAAKIRRVLPARLAGKLDSLLGSLSFTDGHAGPGTRDRHAAPDPAVLLTIADAVSHRRPVTFTYTDRNGSVSERSVQPYGIVSHAGRWYVSGRDAGLDDERTFRLDRITGVRTLPGTFEPPAGDPAQRVLAGFATAAYRYEVTVRIRGTLEQIRVRLPAAVAIVHEPSDDGWRRVEMRMERLDWLPPLLAALDLPFEVERPDELRDLLLALAERLAASARRQASPEGAVSERGDRGRSSLGAAEPAQDGGGSMPPQGDA